MTSVQTIIDANIGTIADVQYIGSGNDVSSSGRKGAGWAPWAIRQALDTQIEFDEPLTGIRTVDLVKFGWRDYHVDDCLRPLERLTKALDKVEHAVFDAFETNRFPFMIGGNHSNTIGALRALRRHVKNPAKTAIVVIDAHHDLRPDDSDYCSRHQISPLAHCCALREAVEAGFRVVQVGVRAYSREEKEFAAQHGVQVFYWQPADLNAFVYDGFVQPPIINILGKICGADNVYLTIDVDGFDPSVMPATGTPVVGGLTWEYGLRLIAGICMNFNLIGADICEVAVPYRCFKTESNLIYLTDLPAAEYRTVINAAQLSYSIPTWAKAMKKI
ncbi:MAG: arginase family protein [Patescibacteria group bacterium]